jgi:hypothetical protein
MTRPVEYWLWKVTDPRTGKVRRTTYRMTEAHAEQSFPGAERIPGSVEIRNVPENIDEQLALTHNLRGRNRPPGVS